MTYCLVWTQLDARSIDQLTMYIQQLMYTVCYRMCHLLNFAIKHKNINSLVSCRVSYFLDVPSHALHTVFVTLNGSGKLYSTRVLRMLCNMAFNCDHVSFEINVKPYLMFTLTFSLIYCSIPTNPHPPQ
jgi:hypothetical protein